MTGAAWAAVRDPLGLTVAVGLLLCWIIFEDLRRYRIRNTAILALVAGSVIDVVLRGGLVSLLAHGGFALLAFGLLSVFFVLRAIGGGDVKLLSAALLWVGPEGCAVYAAALLLCTTAYLAGTWARLLPVRDRAGRRMIPYGPSIAAAWIVQMVVSTWVGG